MKLILHIGTEKTGTTTIQEVLFESRKCLEGRGFHFVQSAGVKNNRKIPAYCINEDRYDDFFKSKKITTSEEKRRFKEAFFDSFKTEIENLPDSIHTVIISSEHLHSRTNSIEEIENVKRFLSAFFGSIKVICYVREQSAVAESLYSTAIKGGASASLKTFLSTCKPGNRYYNYYEMLSSWREVFGAENLVVRKFSRAGFKDGDLINDFFNLIDDELVKCISRDISAKNESLTMTGQLICRTINQAFPEYDGVGQVKNPVRVNAINATYLSFKGKGESVDQNDYDKIYSSFEESNIKLNEEFFGGLNGVNCFSKVPRKETCGEAVLDENDIPKLVDVFKGISSASIVLPDHYADFFRRLARSLEAEDLKSAYKLMELAHMVRPNGPLIKRKLDEYKEKLDE